MIKQLITATALVVTVLPFVQTSAQARHIDVYAPTVVAPAAPAVVTPERREFVHPLYRVHVYHHPMYRMYPAYTIHVHH